MHTCFLYTSKNDTQLIMKERNRPNSLQNELKREKHSHAYSETVLFHKHDTENNMIKNQQALMQEPKSRSMTVENKAVKSSLPVSRDSDPLAIGFELFSRFAYHQMLLYKAYIEASEKAAGKIGKIARNDSNVNSLYIDIFEETFTNMFKSNEYSANLGKLMNSLMKWIRYSNSTLRKIADSA